MDIVLWVLFGAITAWIAAIFIGTNTRQQIMSNVLLGVIGAVFAGTTMRLITGHNDGVVNFYSLILAVAGSLFVVAFSTHKKV